MRFRAYRSGMQERGNAGGYGESGDGCLAVAIRMPVRIVALVVVLPLRMAWDALTVAGRALGRAGGWLGRVLVVAPAPALWRYVLVPAGRAVPWRGWSPCWSCCRWWRCGGTCSSRWGGRGAVWAVRVLLVVPLAALYARVLVPLAAGVAWLARWAVGVLVVVPVVAV